MRSILEDLYYGKIHPWEKSAPKNPAILSINREINDLERELKGKLDAQGAKQLDKIDELFCQSSDLHDCESFSQGLKLGMLLIAEAFFIEPWA